MANNRALEPDVQISIKLNINLLQFVQWAMMDHSDLIDKIHELSDLELATLLCLIANQHCIIETDKDALDELEQELQLIVSKIYGLSCAVLHCSINTTIDDFGNAILVNNPVQQPILDSPSTEAVNQPSQSFHLESSYFLPQSESTQSRSASRSSLPDTAQDIPNIANVVIARDLSSASSLVQIQALELIRTKRILSRAILHNAPKTFLVIALLSSSGPKLVDHLNDQIFISHYHDPEDGFPNLEEGSEWLVDDGASTSSVVRKSRVDDPKAWHDARLFSDADLNTLVSRSQAVTITAEVKRYLQNVVIFLRLHRAVNGGISAWATKHFDLLVKCLATLHSLNHVTPSLVALAARKIYPHRISITTPENERSMQYGSELAAVTAMLEGVTPEVIIDEVLAAVEVPL
ncbi:MAG: hypothetical protein M1830_000381 [Pleopsidium flavum]|nr:MAG: hypothetical protein M1830_000381 [Pleopsidium flavum]